MVVVVADTIFEAGRRTGRLDAPEDPFGDQQAERVVHRLQRDRADLGPDGLGNRVGGDVRLPRDGPQDSQPLGCDLNTELAKEIGVIRHGREFYVTFGLIPVFDSLLNIFGKLPSNPPCN